MRDATLRPRLGVHIVVNDADDALLWVGDSLPDDADYNPDYLARVRSPAKGYMSTPFGQDVELSMRIG